MLAVLHIAHAQSHRSNLQRVKVSEQERPDAAEITSMMIHLVNRTPHRDYLKGLRCSPDHEKR